MPYPAVFIQNYLRVSLNPLRTSSFQLRRRLHLSPRLIRPLPPSSRPALVLICSSSSSHVSSSKHLIKRTRNKDSYSLPYFYQQSLPYGRYAYDEYASEEESDRENLQLPQSLGASTLDNIEEWQWKLTTLIRNKDEQEVVSRERKDRRDFEQLSALATRMGLHSHQYSKVVVFSKVALPNYRSDLDDKRPQREVVLPSELHSRVDYHLKSYLSQKSATRDGYPNNTLPTSRTSESLVGEADEPLRQSPVAEGILRRKSFQLRNKQQDWQESVEGQKMQELRRSLPAYKEKEALLNAISRNQVIVVSGETGCGKTTQLPQYILESEIEAARGAVCSIICTQPRRISAMSVAERVAAERGEKLGDSVGYKVRLEGIKGRDTRLLFCTTGILLRRLLLDRSLQGVTHVIVDEIHERGMNEDFLLIVLKELLPRRPELKLILMSATLNAELFSSYFGGAPMMHIPGFTYPVRSYFLENILEMTGYRLSTYNQIDNYGQEKSWKMQKQTLRKRKTQIASAAEDALGAADLRELNPWTRDSLSCWNPDSIGFNLIENVVCHICKKERPGAILVFMTGWDDINSLKDQLQSHPLLGDPTKVLLLACHVSLKTMEDGPVLLYLNSVNAQEPRIPYPWLVFNEKVKVNTVFLRDSTAVSDSVVLLFGGTVSKGAMDGHLKMLGGYLEFFMKPGLAATYLTLKRELDELIQMKLLNPKIDIGNENEKGLVEALKLLVSGDRCEGRFVHGRKVSPVVLKKETKNKKAASISSTSGSGSVAEHDNSKNHLQTMLLRAGHQPPSYKTSQLKNNKFRSTVVFNGLDFVGQPCGSKKLAEKSAASEALHWLTEALIPIPISIATPLPTKALELYPR
ncbi:unnamed protein product [Lactuca saligna]|uniref:RNA helicase n=1 Tax=Lactuca saligna TaxID=75948 RepID=A0AA35ZMZ9_LACSI|nr:unnamed protein product [Lactuca saligna]